MRADGDITNVSLILIEAFTEETYRAADVVYLRCKNQTD